MVTTSKQTNKINTTRHLKVLSEYLSRDQKHDHVKLPQLHLCCNPLLT